MAWGIGTRHQSRKTRLAVLTAVAMLSGVLGGSAVTAGASTLPSCSYRDDSTTYRATADWARTLVDTRYRLTSSYAPGDLVSVSRAGFSSSQRIRSIVIKDLDALRRAARAADASLSVRSAYRSYGTQVSTFAYWASVAGYQQALLTSARPGHSEHQLGTTLDFTSAGGKAPWLYADWGTTNAGAWMREHAWQYGFVMSYPKGRSPSVSCYSYEPWHFRYVGRATAKAIHDSGQAPRQWLWEQGAITGWVPQPTPTPRPTPVPSPTQTPGPTAVPSPTPTATPDPDDDAAPTSSPDLGAGLARLTHQGPLVSQSAPSTP